MERIHLLGTSPPHSGQLGFSGPSSPSSHSSLLIERTHEIRSSEITLVRELGKGAFGVVYEGILRGKPVAVKKLFQKELSESQKSDFMHEAGVMQQLLHPNVLLCMGAVMEPDNMMIVTELMKKGSVEDMVRNPDVFKTMSFKLKMQIAKQTAQGMNWLHDRTPVFIHRDLKTANLLIDENYTVKVADFGLTHIKSHEGGFNGTYGALGTPLWMAPEVLLNQPYNEKVDLYGFGIILWELLTGSEPFPEITSIELMIQKVCVEHARPEIPKCPPLLHKLITSCWHPNPEMRPKFSEILPVFDTLIIEDLLPEDVGAGRNFWAYVLQHSRGEFEIDWKKLKELWIQFFGWAGQEEKFVGQWRWDCFKAVLCPDKNNETVTIEKFSQILSWFGPLGDGVDVLENVFNLVQQSYFFGPVDASGSERLLKGKEKGTFLARFSTTPGSFTISTIDTSSGKVKHYRIIHSPGSPFTLGNRSVPQLQDFPLNYGAQLGLLKPCEGSPYEKIFVHKDDEENPYGAYESPDFEDQ